MNDGMDRVSIANRVRCYVQKHDPRDCVYCEASHFLDVDADALEQAQSEIEKLKVLAKYATHAEFCPNRKMFGDNLDQMCNCRYPKALKAVQALETAGDSDPQQQE